MLWLLIIVLTAGLLFVLFNKPSVNTMGVGWVPPHQRQQPQANAAPTPQVTADGSGAVQQPVAPAPQTPDTFDLNDVFGAKKPTPPTDRPNS